MKTSIPRKLVKNYIPRKHQPVCIACYKIFTPVDPSRTIHESDGSFCEPEVYLARIKQNKTQARAGPSPNSPQTEPGADSPSKKERFPSEEGSAAAARGKAMARGDSCLTRVAVGVGVGGAVGGAVGKLPSH
jgi:hypothetical protein